MYSLAIVNNTVIHVFVHIIILSDTPIRMAKIQTLTTLNAGEDVKQQQLLFCWWECKVAQLLWKTVWQFLIKLNLVLLYDPAITFLGFYPTDLNTCFHMRT